MADFDFLTNSDMRQCLMHDYEELKLAAEVNAHKAVLVLAGSIVEAVLVDYLLAFGPKGRGAKSPLSMDLSGVIDLCHKDGVLSGRTKDLCSAVRSYRNLIHPGRLVRLKEAVDANSASVATGVVEIVADEVGRAFSTKRGLSCEQLMNKIESDPNALAIMPHLVSHFRGSELERLVVEVLPSRYQRLRGGDVEDDRREELTRRYRACFEAAFANASKTLKKKATLRTLAIVREGTGDAVQSCDDVFLMAEGLDALSGRDHDTLRDHLLARLGEPSEFVLSAAQGVGSHLALRDVGQFFNPLARQVSNGGGTAFKSQQLLITEFRRMNEGCQQAVIGLTQSHIKFWGDREKWERAERLKVLMRALDPTWVDPDADDDIPF